MSPTTLTTAARTYHELSVELARYIADSNTREADLRARIAEAAQIMRMGEEGIDVDKVALAKTVIYVRGLYAHAGQDRASVISDATQQLSTGKPVGNYSNLWNEYFGTKNYDRWGGQRSDHSYGCGPRHGYTVFEVGLTRETRQRDPKILTPEETEAAIYYLLNLERVQAAEQAAKTQVEVLT